MVDKTTFRQVDRCEIGGILTHDLHEDIKSVSTWHCFLLLISFCPQSDTSIQVVKEKDHRSKV